ncbi:MAG: hypothetical protein JWP12_71 [Bacteroidetes bacterium]|nr:hypothetical protein [Bacteroidota bacterium]
MEKHDPIELVYLICVLAALLAIRYYRRNK